MEPRTRERLIIQTMLLKPIRSEWMPTRSRWCWWTWDTG